MTSGPIAHSPRTLKKDRPSSFLKIFFAMIDPVTPGWGARGRSQIDDSRFGGRLPFLGKSSTGSVESGV